MPEKPLTRQIGSSEWDDTPLHYTECAGLAAGQWCGVNILAEDRFTGNSRSSLGDKNAETMNAKYFLF